MSTLTIDNPIPTAAKNVKSYLTAAANAGDTSLALSNNEGFTANRYVQIGETGAEQTELKLFSALTGATGMTVSALSFAHGANTSVYEMRYNQFRIYRTRSSSTSLLATINIQPGGMHTVYVDPGTLTGDTYSISYYNSTTGDETPQTSQIALTGAATNSLFSLRKRFRDKWQDTQKRFSDDILNTFANEIIRDLYYAAQEQDEDYGLVGPIIDTNATQLADGSGTSFNISSSSRIFKWLYVSYGDGVYNRKAREEDIRNYDPNQSYTANLPIYNFTGTNIILHPSGCTGISYYHYPILTELTKDDDVPPAPLGSYPDIIVEGMLWIAAETPGGSQEMAASKQRNYEKLRARFLRSITDRQLEQTGHIELEDERHLATTEELGVPVDYGRI